jgi:hypothetical protein
VIPRLVVGLVLLAAAVASIAEGFRLTTIDDYEGTAQFLGGCFIAGGFIVAGAAVLVLRSANAKRRRNVF